MNKVYGQFANSLNQSLEIDCENMNTVVVVLQGNWPGHNTIYAEAKVEIDATHKSGWFPMFGADQVAEDGQTPNSFNANTILKFPVTGFTKFRMQCPYAFPVGITCDIYMTASEGVEVQLETLSEDFVQTVTP